MENKKNLPILYSCSGCSSAAQMANHIAVYIDRQGIAEMSCIAGVGGNGTWEMRVTIYHLGQINCFHIAHVAAFEGFDYVF